MLQEMFYGIDEGTLLQQCYRSVLRVVHFKAVDGRSPQTKCCSAISGYIELQRLWVYYFNYNYFNYNTDLKLGNP